MTIWTDKQKLVLQNWCERYPIDINNLFIEDSGEIKKLKDNAPDWVEETYKEILIIMKRKGRNLLIDAYNYIEK